MRQSPRWSQEYVTLDNAGPNNAKSLDHYSFSDKVPGEEAMALDGELGGD